MVQKLLTCPVILATFIGVAGCDLEALGESRRFKEEFHQSYDLKPGSRVSVESFNGSVEIVGWDKNSVEISGTKYAATEDLLAAIRVDIVPGEDAVRVRAVRPVERGGNMGCSFVIRVPSRTDLDRIDSSNGSIRIENVNGSARLRTSNGAIRVNGLRGEIDAATSNGSVDLQGFDGSAVVRTSNGRIRADRVRGHLEATTSNGGIEARLDDPAPNRPVKLNTSNGSIQLTLDGQAAPEVRASTSNATITVRMPESLGAQVQSVTSNGSITSELDVTGKVRTKNRLEGAVGAGGSLLDLRTSNGSIRLLRL